MDDERAVKGDIVTFNADDELDEVDREALQRALAIRLAGDDRVFIRNMLARGTWLETARHCAFHCQVETLGLRPWECPPAAVELSEGPEVRAFCARLAAAGISRFDPSPLEALAAAKPRNNSQVSKSARGHSPQKRTKSAPKRKRRR